MKKLGFLLSVLLVTAFSACAPQRTVDRTGTNPTPYRVGEWLPSDQAILEAWMESLIARTAAKAHPLSPVVRELKELIENDPELYMLFNQMFDQIPNKPPYDVDPTGKPQVREYQHMLGLLNQVMTEAPEFNKTGVVGFPINAILDWPMGTQAGTSAFLNPKVNKQLKKILNKWAEFLRSPDSSYVLNDDPRTGWFGRDAKEAMPTFVQDFKCDPKLPHHGFASWDKFFTREFRKGRRPVASPKDDAVIVSAAESAPYRIATNVKKRNKFWIKGQPYSLYHMMAGDPLVDRFVGGTVYQAFLSALAYHRWHSPVSGRIVKTKVIDGTYYAESLAEGFDPAGPNQSQGYITETATRGLVCIEADNPDIGLMCAIFIGMAEVSSIEFTVYEGQHVTKGEQLGMFHYGGSTHTLIFRPGVRLEFDMHGQTPGLDAGNIQVRARLATVQSK